MAKHVICICAVFLSLFISCISFALPDDREKTLYLRANKADINQATHKGIYTGDVELDQGSSHLRAAFAITQGNESNQLIKAFAKGDTHAQAHFWCLTAHNKPVLHAYADKIYYYPNKHIIELVGNAKVSQGENTFQAPTILYNVEQQHVITKRSGNQRTSITIYPEKKS
ncbi:lipopolysaccharide transport periplasmic protein LptA [Legionella impletisoli]|uniref:Lipopolysaccharide transport periplasmic protein LptA n=1 Tax=Legionella impletisoli TaxID=343510 RepID=A0A917JQ75_9GAMM|nr:lipopolysaccharide transport periplasmic protein LptA [Legionella impletisoli]GGI81028.1 lipopolysaccharide transport periplasmic protein LptA [Legionella impletisoli]